MKTKKMILMVFAVMSIVGCTQPASQKEHQIETISELYDTLSKQGIYVQYYILCRDSVLREEYSIDNMLNTTAIEDSAKHQFLLEHATAFVEKLCKTAEKSYRYISGDSVNYSLTLNDSPEEYITLIRHKDAEVKEREWINFYYSNLKPVKPTEKSLDFKPVQKVLQEFLSEQKDVKPYEVKYEWDKGVAIPANWYGDFYEASRGLGSDSLAAASVTGTHYFIPAKDEHRIKVSLDFINRITQLAKEQPVSNSFLKTSARPESKMENNNSFFNFLSYKIFNPETHRNIYIILTEQSPEGIHILELYTADAPRFAIPRNWYDIKQTHNFERIPEKDFEF